MNKEEQELFFATLADFEDGLIVVRKMLQDEIAFAKRRNGPAKRIRNIYTSISLLQTRYLYDIERMYRSLEFEVFKLKSKLYDYENKEEQE